MVVVQLPCRSLKHYYSNMKKIVILVTLLGLGLSNLASGSSYAIAQPVKTSAPIDPSVVDPVGQLQKISAQVKASSAELETIAAELDKLNGELDKLEGKTAKNIDRKQFAALEKRFDVTLARSAAVEKKVGLSLGKSLKDIDNVRAALKKVEHDRQVDRQKGKKPIAILSDKDLKECLKDLADLDKTVRELQANLKDNQK